MSLLDRQQKSRRSLMVLTVPYTFGDLAISHSLVIAENGVKLRLNIVDTPGYGDQVNNENW